MAPDMGTNEQVMALVHGHLLGACRLCHRLRSSPASRVSIARRRRPPRSDRPRRVVFLVERALDHLKIKPSEYAPPSCRDSAMSALVTAGGLGFKSGMKVVGHQRSPVALYDPQGHRYRRRRPPCRQAWRAEGFPLGERVDAEDIPRHSAVRRACPGRCRSASLPGEKCRPTQMPHPRRGRQRPHHSRCG